MESTSWQSKSKFLLQEQWRLPHHAGQQTEVSEVSLQPLPDGRNVSSGGLNGSKEAGSIHNAS